MIKIIAIGNKLMGDDGIALYILPKIRERIKLLTSDIEMIIGETDPFYCLNKINDEDIVIIIDSTFLGLEIGKVTLITFHDYERQLRYSMSQHDSSLIDMILNYKANVKGYVVGIEIDHIEFDLNISEHLKTRLITISNNVFNQIKVILGENNA